MKRRKVEETEANSEQSETGSVIFVYANLPFVHLKLSVQHSFTVQQLQQLGVANISVCIAKSSMQFAGRLALFRSLKTNIQRPVGTKCNSGIPDRLDSHPHQAHKPARHDFSKDETESLESEI